MAPNGRRREVMDPPPEPRIPRAVARKPAPERPKRPAKPSDARTLQKPKRNQRERLLDAMLELCTKGGYQAVSIEALCARAGVSPQTFYEQFGSKEGCFLAAYVACGQRMFAHMRALSGQGDWHEVARLALGELLRAVASDPAAGRLLFIEALGAGPAIAAERARVLAELERGAEEVLARTPADRNGIDVPLTAVIGALRHIISRQLRTHAADQLPTLLEDGLAWLSCYAVPAGSARWSTSPAALLEGTREPSPPAAWKPERLPPGRHGLSGEAIARSQHTRLIFGTAEAMMAKGYHRASVDDIVAAAGVAKPVFYEHFADKQHAFLEVQQYPTQYILDRCAQAYYSARVWPERVWRCFEVLLSLIAANPAISHLRLVECYAAGPVAIRRAEEITRSFTIFLAEGYHYREQARSLPRLCSQAIAGAIFEIVQRLIARGEAGALAAHLPQLTYIAIAPFTGAREAIDLVEQMKARQQAAA